MNRPLFSLGPSEARGETRRKYSGEEFWVSVARSHTAPGPSAMTHQVVVSSSQKLDDMGVSQSSPVHNVFISRLFALRGWSKTAVLGRGLSVSA